MLKKVALLVAILVLALPFVGVSAQDGTIVEVAAANGSFTTLLAAVEAAGLTETLSGEGPFTVFAPTDDAFAALPAGAVDALLANPELLTAVLTYHVLPEAIDGATAMGMMGAADVATVNGATVNVVGDDSGVTVDGVTVVMPDVAASNGIIHVIDEVLIPPVPLPEIDPLSITGEIIAAGSSTVAPLTQNAIEAFIEAGFSGSITNDSIGTGAGFERFCEAGETDISNASRAIREEEVATCAALATPRTPLEFQVGVDALTVVVSAENDFLTDISIEQLSQIYSGAVTTWDQVDPSYPAEAIQVFSPGSDSGTFDYFLEVTLTADAEDGGLGLEGEAAEAAIAAVPGIQFSEDDNVLVQGVGGSPFAIGYFGYAYYVENAAALKALSVNGVAPTAETAESGEYPISRPLFIYSDAGILAAKPQVADFINFYLVNLNSLYTGAAQYFPISIQSQREQELELLLNYPSM
jgi:phosphate transport system substrate-binding protein